MVKIFITATGDKHCELIHEPSGTQIETDAPLDNKGKGEKFSPTDLVAAALGSCVLTTMEIFCERESLSMKGATCEVTKEMTPPPRRIGKLTVRIQMPEGIPKNFRERLEAAAHHCPVHKSLHPDVDAPLTFSYPD